ncbi:MAG: Xaa-Pro dipeptidase, partial [Verrucomicrobia bacterium]|nr:Xaa-Pro dipeptidase [Verrucomicrobiota bacterium]
MPTFLSDRRARLAAALELDDAILLIAAGEPIPLPENTDQTYPFRAHAEYYFVAAQECPGGVVAFDPRDGGRDGWVSFVPDVTEGERVWEGRTQPAGESIRSLETWLSKRRGRPVVVLGAPLKEIESDAARSLRVRECFHHARRIKDATELELLRGAAKATAAGFAQIPALLRPGVSERSLKIELEAEFFRHGGTRTGYGTIVGTGPNAAILHFEPSARAAREGEFVLVDAGAEIDRYVCDVTRTFVVGKPSAFQRDLYQVVLAAEEHALVRCVPGTEWRENHLAAAVELTAGLVSMGVMRGKPESLVEQDAHTLFFPHGLGHMVGLGVRDASGQLPRRPKSARASLATLRLDLPL